jgi:hypothetical protein
LRTPCHGLSARRLKFGFGFGLHVVTLVDRLDAEIGEEANHEQPGHDVHGGVVGLRLRHAVRDVEFADVVDQYRAGDSGSRPCGEQDAVDGADVRVPNMSRR